jgi:hypothetical protein
VPTKVAAAQVSGVMGMAEKKTTNKKNLQLFLSLLVKLHGDTLRTQSGPMRKRKQGR